MGSLTILTIVGVGLGVGLFSGLVGLGGGVLIVPFLYFFYDRPDLFGVAVSEETRTVLAHGTSLFVIMPTSIRGAFAFHRSGLVEWRAVWPIGIAAAAFAALGARLALVLPPEVLKVAFGGLLVYSGVRSATHHHPVLGAPEAEPRLTLPVTLSSGVAVGLFSAVLGVGGGVVAIPLMMHLMRLQVRKVAATSIGVITLTAAAGSASYMLNGLGTPGLPRWSVGYVDVLTGSLMFLGSALTVGWGATLNQRLKPRTLSLVFGGLFVLLGVRLVLTNAALLLPRAW